AALTRRDSIRRAARARSGRRPCPSAASADQVDRAGPAKALRRARRPAPGRSGRFAGRAAGGTSGNREHVTDAADRLEQSGVARVVSELLAEMGDVHVDVTIERLVGGAAHRIDALVTSDDIAGAVLSKPL